MNGVDGVGELLEAVRRGRFGEVPGLLKPLTAAERKAALADVKTLRAELRGWGWDRWQERGRAQAAVLVAGAGCHTGAAAAAAWIGARDLRDAYPLPRGPVLEVLSGREPAWLGDVAHRLAGRASTAQEDYPLIHELVRLAGCPVPTTDGYVHGWVEAVSHPRSGGLRRIRRDPDVRTLVPRLFETAVLARQLAWYSDPEAPDQWPSVLAGLADDGVVERSVLVDGCVSRLLRGGRPGDLRFFLALARRLALTAEEERARVGDWLGMAADGPPAVAGHAQSVLAGLAQRGELSAQDLAEMSGAVLFRTERKLVRAQLVLLGKVLRQDSESAPVLLPVLAEAFGHEDVGVQERALKLVARHLSAVDGGLRSELVAAAALLSPAHREAAVKAFGPLPEEPTPAYEEKLPPVPERGRLAPAADSVAELVEDLVVGLRGGQDMSGFERTLDGLMRLAHRAPDALTAAVRGALADRWWLDAGSRWDPDDRFSAHPHGMEVVVAALLGRVSVRVLHDARVRAAGGRNCCAHGGLDGITHARLWEAAYAVRTRPLPFLLATPTWRTGALDPQDLVERLRAHQSLGIPPAPVDFAQALLRVERAGAGAAAEDAARLGTAEGDRLAAWLTGAGPALPALRPGEDEPAGGTDSGLLQRSARTTRLKLHESRERRAVQREFPRPFHWLGQGPGSLRRMRCHHWTIWQSQWAAVLPHDREALADWVTTGLAASAAEGLRGLPRCLPELAEAEAGEGPAGPALHRALAIGLGARSSDDRLAAVDALLTLAARGQLDGPLLGRELPGLVRSGRVKPNRLAEAVRTAAATGAYATTWSVLAGALPGLLATAKPGRGQGEIVAVAADCVERCGGAAIVPVMASTGRTIAGNNSAGTCEAASGGIPGLAEVAARRGSSQLVAQASRLVTALDRATEHSPPESAKSSL